MTKEELRLRKRIGDAVWRGTRWSWSTYDQDIRALVRACYEDAANRGNKAYMDGEVVHDAIMAGIRRKGK